LTWSATFLESTAAKVWYSSVGANGGLVETNARWRFNGGRICAPVGIGEPRSEGPALPDITVTAENRSGNGNGKWSERNWGRSRVLERESGGLEREREKREETEGGKKGGNFVSDRCGGKKLNNNYVTTWVSVYECGQIRQN